jgi:hypothetical protein
VRWSSLRSACAARPGGPWGFEATGPVSLLRGELEAIAALVFAEALPGGVELSTADSQSYAQGLSGGQLPSDTGAYRPPSASAGHGHLPSS